MEPLSYDSAIYMVAEMLNRKAIPGTVWIEKLSGSVYLTVSVSLHKVHMAMGRLEPNPIHGLSVFKREYQSFGRVSTEYTFPQDKELKAILADVYKLV